MNTGCLENKYFFQPSNKTKMQILVVPSIIGDFYVSQLSLKMSTAVQ